ncbi:hypothetical protein JXB41_06880 [Candidatus Woesearchaeota archaeon]|nr:hypothetical protein [Candidatus Woesearchaeota archaeon]
MLNLKELFRVKFFLHKIIHLNFIMGIVYATFKVFTTPRSEYFLRRLYAFEAWLIIGFFAVYYALTDYKKRKYILVRK